LAGQSGRGPSNVLCGIVVTLAFENLLRDLDQMPCQRRACEKE